MKNEGSSGGKSLEDESGENEASNNNSNQVNPTADKGLSEKELKFKRLQEEKLRKYKEEELEKLKVITNQIVERDPKALHAHEVNVVLYGHEEVDLALVNSIENKGQLEPIVITNDNTIISGHRRWLALKYINENKLTCKKLNKGSIKKHDEDLIEMKARCVVVNLPREEDRILAVIEYNKRRKKRPSQYYNEIRMLHELYDAEAAWSRNSHLRQFTVSTDLKKRYKKEDSTLTDEQYYSNLYDEGKISDDEIKNSDDYRKAKKEDNKNTLNRISDEILLGRTNINKLTSIGNLAHNGKDQVAIDIMQRLDFFIWSFNNAYNVYKLRIFQTKFAKDSDLYREIDEKINNVLEASKNKPDKNFKNRTDFVIDKDIQKYQDIVDELESKGKKKKEKDVFSVILIEPEDNTEITEKFNISNCSTSSVLFVIATNKNLAACMTLITKLKYIYQTFYFFGDKLLLLGTKGKLPPEILTDKIESRNKLYAKIREYYPNENYHEVPNINTPKEEPDGWEVPIEKLVSNKQARKQVNSKKKSSNFTGTNEVTKSTNNEPVGTGQA